MSDPTPNVKPTVEPKASDKKAFKPETLQTASFQIPHAAHLALESASDAFGLDKAGMCRLAVRLLFMQFYDGNGKWRVTAEVQKELIYADNAKYFLTGLK